MFSSQSLSLTTLAKKMLAAASALGATGTITVLSRLRFLSTDYVSDYTCFEFRPNTSRSPQRALNNLGLKHVCIYGLHGVHLLSAASWNYPEKPSTPPPSSYRILPGYRIPYISRTTSSYGIRCFADFSPFFRHKQTCSEYVKVQV